MKKENKNILSSVLLGTLISLIIFSVVFLIINISKNQQQANGLGEEPLSGFSCVERQDQYDKSYQFVECKLHDGQQIRCIKYQHPKFTDTGVGLSCNWEAIK